MLTWHLLELRSVWIATSALSRPYSSSPRANYESPFLARYMLFFPFLFSFPMRNLNKSFPPSINPLYYIVTDREFSLCLKCSFLPEKLSRFQKEKKTRKVKRFSSDKFSSVSSLYFAIWCLFSSIRLLVLAPKQTQVSNDLNFLQSEAAYSFPFCWL